MKKKTRAELQNEIMTGQTQDWTHETVHALYPKMPSVADAVWQNILNQRGAAKTEQAAKTN